MHKAKMVFIFICLYHSSSFDQNLEPTYSRLDEEKIDEQHTDLHQNLEDISEWI